MKRITSLILLAILTVSFAACGPSGNYSSPDGVEAAVSQTAAETAEEKESSQVSFIGGESSVVNGSQHGEKISDGSSVQGNKNGTAVSDESGTGSTDEPTASNASDNAFGGESRVTNWGDSESADGKESSAGTVQTSENKSSAVSAAAQESQEEPSEPTRYEDSGEGSEMNGQEGAESASMQSTEQSDEQEVSRQASYQESSVKPREESSVSDIPADPDTPIIKNVRTMVDSIELSWGTISGADGYIVQYSQFPSLAPQKSQFAETTETGLTLTGLSMNKTYYLRVCSYRKENSGQKTSSEWSVTRTENLKSFEVIDGVTYIDGLVIANKTYGLPAEYGDGLDSETYAAFSNLAAAAANDGIYLYIISDFRSYYTQSFTYNSFVYDRGVEQADRCSARPGHSEHQTGFAIDVNTTSDYFAGTPEAIWLENNCVRFGFIIRYPKDKEDITGYKYEPWHIRYVGAQKAAEITNSGLTVEEYYGITSVYQD